MRTIWQLPPKNGIGKLPLFCGNKERAIPIDNLNHQGEIELRRGGWNPKAKTIESSQFFNNFPLQTEFIYDN